MTVFFACRLLKKARVRTQAEQKRRLDHQVQFFRSFQFFYFVFVYQLCELFILLINLICQIAYFVISFIATVCDSRQFSGNSDVTMKLIKTRRNLVMVKKNLIKKNKESRMISNGGFSLISLCILQSRTLQAYRNEKQKRSRIWSRSS